ncbi:MAG: hypothetical protein H6581_00565 [Bacteroidia bacterium]|nr:hypothetical protein [Bacteroidia bacterium]
MRKIEDYINSGILEQYVTGDLGMDEMIGVEKYAVAHPEVRKALDELQNSLELMAFRLKQPAPSNGKERFMAAIARDQRENLNSPEPRILNPNSKIEDFAPWLNNQEIKAPEEYDNIFYVPIAENEDSMSAVVWMKEGSPAEVHESYVEKFLIIEGSCDITIGDKVHSLFPGSYLSIPLFVTHSVKVTSPYSCKIILQRVSA